VIGGEVGAYGAAFPDCPGCTTMGETTDEVIANAGKALRE
jgi:predicted RNase H-like HicB family nuclease